MKKPFLGRFDISQSLKPVKEFDKKMKHLWTLPTALASQFLFINPAFAANEPPPGFESLSPILNEGPL